MKPSFMRILLRWWIALTSLAAFLTGWVVLGHFQGSVSASSSSTPAAELAPLPTLEPLPSLDSSQVMRPLQLQQPSFSSGFRLRTGAS
jgi:hypothetical protein